MVDLSSRRALFWDVKESDIPNVLANSDEWVIVRVLQYGTLEDIRAVIDLYGEERCRQMVSHLSLPPVANAMAYMFLGVDRYGKYAS